MSKLSEALEEIAELRDELEAGVTVVEAHCSSIPITWVEYPGGRVGLDAAGSMVRVEFDPSPYGWVAER